MHTKDQANVALLAAADLGDAPAIRAALAAGADPNVRNHEEGSRKYSALHLAACKGASEAITALVEGGASLALEDQYGRSPLEAAVQFYNGPDREDFAIWMVGLDNEATKKGQRAITLASELGFVRLIDVLGELGCRPERSSIFGENPLVIAARRGHLDAVKRLLDLGADVEWDDPNGYTALHVAAECGLTDIVNCLLGAGADPNSQQVAGYTALHSLASKDHGELVQVLLASGADPVITNNYGHTPFRHAVNAGAPSVIAALEVAGFGETLDLDQCLANAAKAGKVAMVREMLARGADPTFKPYGKTLLQHAKSDATEVKQMILAARSGLLVSTAVAGSHEASHPPRAPFLAL